VRYLTFLPILVLVLLFACSDVRIDRATPTELRSTSPAEGSDGPAALATPVCETLTKELEGARAKLAADSTNPRLKGRAEALGALTTDVCGLTG
jgi:hypothetical protein